MKEQESCLPLIPVPYTLYRRLSYHPKYDNYDHLFQKEDMADRQTLKGIKIDFMEHNAT